MLPLEAQKTHCSAHGDAPVVWEGAKLVSGGKHYGFLEVEVIPSGTDDYKVIMTPRYVFPLMDDTGVATGEYEQRQYDNVVTILVER